MAIPNSATAEEPPHKKMKMSPRQSSPSWSLLSSLPDELVLSCLARVSRSDQPAMSLVSKRYSSLVASPEFYSTRSVLGYAENCLYACLLSPRHQTPGWFILRRGKTVNKLSTSPIPCPSSHPTEGFSVVALDSGFYVIGGRRNGKLTCNVFFLDCRTHRWRQAPSMRVGRAASAAGVVGGKIYVFGGCCPLDSPNFGEVFDPKTQTWDSLPPMPYNLFGKYIHDNVVVREEKLYAVDSREYTFYYSPNEGKWGIGNEIQDLDLNKRHTRDWCVIDGLIYCIDQDGYLHWSEPELLDSPEPEKMYWKEVKGLGSLQEALCLSSLVHFDSELEALWESTKIRFDTDLKVVDMLPGARLSNSGGNIVLFWDVKIGYHRLEIWCAEISLERRCKGPLEIWGNIEWSSNVKTVDPVCKLDRYKILHSVSVTL